jgi:hypothetical protein
VSAIGSIRFIILIGNVHVVQHLRQTSSALLVGDHEGLQQLAARLVVSAARPFDVQAKLLRFIEDGGWSNRKCRDNLYYRLNAARRVTCATGSADCVLTPRD